jgi:hypothetical protein
MTCTDALPNIKKTPLCMIAEEAAADDGACTAIAVIAIANANATAKKAQTWRRLVVAAARERVSARARCCGRSRRRRGARQPQLSRAAGRGRAQAQIHRREPCARHDGMGLRRRRAPGLCARRSAQHRYVHHFFYPTPPTTFLLSSCHLQRPCTPK